MGGSSKTVSQYNKEAMKPNTLKLLLIKKMSPSVSSVVLCILSVPCYQTISY